MTHLMKIFFVLTAFVLVLSSCNDDINCNNGEQDGDETGIDCGGSCIECMQSSSGNNSNGDILGTWNLVKSYHINSSGAYYLQDEPYLMTLYINDNPNYNKITFTDVADAFTTGFYECSVLPAVSGNGSCTNQSVILNSSYKIDGDLIHMADGYHTYNIVTLSSNELILRWESGSGIIFQVFDKTGEGQSTNLTDFTEWTWNLDSMEINSIKRVNISSMQINFSSNNTTTGFCSKVQPLSQTGTFEYVNPLTSNTETFPVTLGNQLQGFTLFATSDNYFSIYSGDIVVPEYSGKYNFSGNQLRIKFDTEIYYLSH